MTQPKLHEAVADHTWLHFYQMQNLIDQPPLVITRGEGSTVYDQHGKAYIDALAGLFCVNAGYGRKEIADAMYAQALKIHYVSSFSYPNEPAVQVAEQLAERAPIVGNRDARVFFVSGGSEAVESALKISKQYQRARGFAGRYKTISRRLAYHGTTMGALSVTGLSGVRAPFEPLVPGARHVPMALEYRCPYCARESQCNLSCVREIEALVEQEGAETIAAIILEPVQNSGGCIVPAPDYYRRVRELCDRTGIVMIMDEVICGFGRVGHWFGTEHWNVKADIITCAKGLTSGYSPLGAAIVRKDIADTFLGAESKKFMHGITFGGHPVSAAAALANLAIIERENLPQRAQESGAYLIGALREALDHQKIVGDIRGLGLFIGIELVKDKATRESLHGEANMAWLSDQLLANGVICRADDRLDPVIQLSPPLVITKEEIDRVVSVLDDVIGRLETRV
ncbi:MAG: aminotransferase class III-fold pyridoxal phosphate-dependent enzyme [Chloroflexi bacterium]|nr:aminotransferase class III-fold pyridoxal phosphate-dependent enzyme [Chloroflexota bacterium]